MYKIALLVHSGDKSKDIWKYWYYHFKKNVYDLDCIFLSDFIPFNEVVANCENVASVLTSENNWSNGLMNYLKSCKYEYLIYHHEDYFIVHYDRTRLYKLVDMCDKHNIELLKCCGWWSGYIDKDNPHIKTDIVFDENESNEETKCLWLYNNNAPYLISHQSSIWRKDFLLSTLLPNKSPWCHEIECTTNLRQRNVPIYCYRGAPPIDYSETMIKGKKRDGTEQYFNIEL